MRATQDVLGWSKLQSLNPGRCYLHFGVLSVHDSPLWSVCHLDLVHFHMCRALAAKVLLGRAPLAMASLFSSFYPLEISDCSWQAVQCRLSYARTGHPDVKFHPLWPTASLLYFWFPVKLCVRFATPLELLALHQTLSSSTSVPENCPQNILQLGERMRASSLKQND